MGKETEIKYGLQNQEEFDALLQVLETRFPGGWETINMETEYYDTPDRLLAGNHWTLRIRSENGRSVLTCKTPRPDGNRGEWEAQDMGLPHGLTTLVRRGAPEGLMALYELPLRVACGARFTRYCRLTELPGCQVELALDRGVLLGATKELPFWELEVELKQGTEKAWLDWCRSFAGEQNLQKEPKSKFARAAALA